MTATLNNTEVHIPEGYFNIPDYWTVKSGDRVAMVTNTKDHTLSWHDVIESEIGKTKKYAGIIVIRAEHA